MSKIVKELQSLLNQTRNKKENEKPSYNSSNQHSIMRSIRSSSVLETQIYKPSSKPKNLLEQYKTNQIISSKIQNNYNNYTNLRPNMKLIKRNPNTKFDSSTTIYKKFLTVDKLNKKYNKNDPYGNLSKNFTFNDISEILDQTSLKRSLSSSKVSQFGKKDLYIYKEILSLKLDMKNGYNKPSTIYFNDKINNPLTSYSTNNFLNKTKSLNDINSFYTSVINNSMFTFTFDKRWNKLNSKRNNDKFYQGENSKRLFDYKYGGRSKGINLNNDLTKKKKTISGGYGCYLLDRDKGNIFRSNNISRRSGSDININSANKRYGFIDF